MIGAIVGALVGIGVFFIYLDIKKIPYLKTSQAIESIHKKQKNKTSVIEVWLQDLSDFLSRHIRINEFRREALLEKLKAAQIDRTPEQYKADAIVKALVITVIALLGGIFLRILIPFAIVLGIVLYNMEMKKAEKQIKKKQEEIEFELPRLVFTISRTMKHDRDLIHILESYKTHAGPFMKHELEITIADMKSLSQKVAIHRLDARLCSQMVSDVCRGLEAMERGDDTESYWLMIGEKLQEQLKEKLKSKAMKSPKKVKKLSMCLLVCFMLTYLVVILSQIVSSLSTLFG